MWAPKLQLTPCQCRFHFTLRGRAAFKSVSDDPKNLSQRLFFPPQCPCVFDRIDFLLFSVFINITSCFFSVLIVCESGFCFSHYSLGRFRDKTTGRHLPRCQKLMKEQMSNNKKQCCACFYNFSQFYTEQRNTLVKKALGFCSEMNAAVLPCLMSQLMVLSCLICAAPIVSVAPPPAQLRLSALDNRGGPSSPSWLRGPRGAPASV